MNYVIEMRGFPETWAYGLKTPVPKPGDPLCKDNYRGITVLPMMTKIFECLVNNRLVFINEAFDRIDHSNGGFLKGCRTSDNVFILKSVIEKQLYLNQSLYVAFVDFSKAFDFINRNILFYKIIKSGISGRIIDTVKDMYSKTKCSVKTPDGLSPDINNCFGVNQGGTLSPNLFRKYLADMSLYLDQTHGVIINEDYIISHILWADDLILFSNTAKGLQTQMNGLYKFCSNNKMIVNELKTKVMIFGNGEKSDIIFNKKTIEIVDKYKYLGIIFNTIKRPNGDVFREHAQYVKDKANKAIFSILNKTKTFGMLDPKLALFLFDTYIKPILTYGSDIIGYNKNYNRIIERLHLKYIKNILGVKSSTSTVKSSRAPTTYL